MSKVASRPSIPALIGFWIIAVLSLGLLTGAAGALTADISSFRSCNVNGSGLFIDNCGKQSLNGGDFLLALIVLGCIGISISLFVHAWRLSRRPA